MKSKVQSLLRLVDLELKKIYKRKDLPKALNWLDDKKQLNLIKNERNNLKNLFFSYNKNFTNEKENVFFKIDNLKLNIQTYEDLFIINEIFINHCYDFSINGDVVVFDIGMNVGFASLYFAKKKNVIKIHGFEPFSETYNQALKNLSFNPQLKDKILPYNYGLGFENKRLSYPYSYEWKGSIGKRPLSNFKKNNSENYKNEGVQIVDCFDIFNTILKKGEANYILKIDCEGSEYEIIERLSNSSILKQFNLIMVEWHDKGSKILLELFMRNNFITISLYKEGLDTGIIYATKHNHLGP